MSAVAGASLPRASVVVTRPVAPRYARPSRRWLFSLAGLAALVVLSFAARAFLLDGHSFWGDEGYSVYAARLPISEIGTGPDASQMPLYYILLRGWMALAGDTEYATRFLSLLFGVVAVPLLYQVCRRLFDGRVARIAAAIAALSPLYIYYSQEVRPYPMLVALALLMLLALLRAASRPPAFAPWAVYAAASTVAAYTHYSVMPALILWPPLVLLLGPHGLHSLPSARRLLARLLPAGLAVAGTLLALAPWLWRQWQQVREALEVSAGALSLPGVLANMAIVFTLGNNVPKVEVDMSRPEALEAVALPMLLAAPLVLLAVRGALSGRRNRRAGLLVGAMLLLPVLAAYLYGTGRHDVHPRYLIATSPAWMMLVAAGLVELRCRPWLALLGGIVVLIVTGYGLYNYYPDTHFDRDDWRSTVRYILAHRRAGDAIIVDAPYTEPIVSYFDRGILPIYALPDRHPPAAEDVEPLLSEVAGKHGRVWVILWQDFHTDPEHLVARWLEGHGALMDEPGFRDISFVRRYSTLPLVLPALPSAARPVDAGLGEDVRLLGYEVDESEAYDRGCLYVTLYWQAVRPIGAGRRVFVHLVNPAYTAWGLADGRPGYYRFPTNRWQPGTIVRDEYEVAVLPGTPPGEYRLAVGMYDEAGGQRLRTAGGKSDHVSLGPVAIPLQQARPEPSRPAPAGFGESIRLLGYDAPDQAAAGSSLSLTLYWRALAPVDGDYTVFVHLTDASGRPLAQRDSRPADGTYPTGRWEPGYTVRDQYRVPLPTDLPPGEYQLRVGLYSAATGERLPLAGAAPDVTYTTLGTIRIDP